MLDSLLKMFGFKRSDSINQQINKYEGLNREQQNSVVGAYVAEDFSNLPVEQIAQEALRLWRAGQRQQALEVYDRAITLSSENATLLLNRGNLQFELGNVPAAMSDYERAREGRPPLPEHIFTIQQMVKTLGPDSPVLKKMMEKRRNERPPA